ncbi:Pre-mRNA-splicing factor 38A [Meyerozyma sp. JA9]|nr:Pre-mRNA-splicing factor 38A [Meyerozyma sp. JA9]
MTDSYNDKRHVLNGAKLVEHIVRHRIHDSLFYKQHLYLTNEQTLLPVIVENVTFIGGTDANGRPSPFICCLLRLLEIEPEERILAMYETQLGYNRFKYLTCLVMIYYRLTKSGADTYRHLEPYYKDYRMVRMQLKVPEFENGSARHFKVHTIDQWADDLLQQERVVDIILPRLVPRHILMQRGELEPRVYHIEERETESEDSFESDSE